MSGGNDNNLIRNFFQYSGVKNCIFFKVISHGHQDYSLNKIIFFWNIQVKPDMEFHCILIAYLLLYSNLFVGRFELELAPQSSQTVDTFYLFNKLSIQKIKVYFLHISIIHVVIKMRGLVHPRQR